MEGGGGNDCLSMGKKSDRLSFFRTRVNFGFEKLVELIIRAQATSGRVKYSLAFGRSIVYRTTFGH